MAYRPHPTAGWRTWRRYLTGAMTEIQERTANALAEAPKQGFSAGQQDATNKAPQQWEPHFMSVFGELFQQLNASGELADMTNAANLKESFRKAYMDGYGGAAVELEKVIPGAQAQLKAINVQESQKIDRDLDPAAFSAWEHDHLAEIRDLEGAGETLKAAAMIENLGLGVLAGIFPDSDSTDGTDFSKGRRDGRKAARTDLTKWFPPEKKITARPDFSPVVPAPPKGSQDYEKAWSSGYTDELLEQTNGIGVHVITINEDGVINLPALFSYNPYGW
jgi:hypothetical protein